MAIDLTDWDILLRLASTENSPQGQRLTEPLPLNRYYRTSWEAREEQRVLQRLSRATIVLRTPPSDLGNFIRNIPGHHSCLRPGFPSLFIRAEDSRGAKKHPEAATGDADSDESQARTRQPR
jgi:hypothetical protein